MTATGPDPFARLWAVASSHPHLADRVATLVEDLLDVEPAPEERDQARLGVALARLQSRGLVADGLDFGGDGVVLSAVVHRALTLILDARIPAHFVGMTADVALALGRDFEPNGRELFRLHGRATAHDEDIAHEMAFLAGLGGAEALVATAADDLAADPEPVLEFLQAVVDAYFEGPRLGRTSLTAPPFPDDEEYAELIDDEDYEDVAGSGRRVVDQSGRPWRADDLDDDDFDDDNDEEVRHRIPIADDWAPPPPPPTSPPEPPPPSGPVVSTGFATAPGVEGLPAERTLAVGQRYLFFMEIGRELARDAIDTAATTLPPLPEGTVLQVALFGFPGELEPEAGVDAGELRLRGDGTAAVETQPGGVPLGERRLYLGVRTPDGPGIYRMRCNIYCRQALLQSRLVFVQVTDVERTLGGPVLSTVLDFAAVSDLEPGNVAAIRPRTLSLLVNDNDDGTHGFRFFAGTEFKHDATLSGDVLGETLEQARAGLRFVSWGTKTEPTRAEFADLPYRYAQPDADLVAQDLVTLARSGFIVWDVLVGSLSGGDDEALAERMRKPGVVELSNKESLDLLVPAACIYDHPLFPEAVDLTLCPEYLGARGSTPLANTPCFQGECPSYGDSKVVCPSGFWGFRHQIGYSASLTGGAPEDARNHQLAIPAGAGPEFTAAASADPTLRLRDGHLRRIQQIAADRWHFAWSRTDLFDLFQTIEPSVVYLYGHGGKRDRAAYFTVGSEADGPIIRASLRGRADWRRTRPLVFLNGCHSAALAPDAAFSYATGFLQTAHASAVVGTEIAVFERLAVVFAEDCLRRFVTDRRPLGEAVLATRLALLDADIPLGLAYLAFGPPELTLT
jgi:hypothetical protein